MPENISSICCNCLYDIAEHAADPDANAIHCPTGDGGYYFAVGFVPFKNNLEYLERLQFEKEEKEKYEALCRRSKKVS